MFIDYSETELSNRLRNESLPVINERSFRLIKYHNIIDKISLLFFFKIFSIIIFCGKSFSQVPISAISIKIDTLLQILYSRDQFKGCILVSIYEKVVYKKAYGNRMWKKIFLSTF